jgi:hypothetical protein
MATAAPIERTLIFTERPFMRVQAHYDE